MEPILVRTSTLTPDYIKSNLGIVNRPVLLHVSEEVEKVVKLWSPTELDQERKLVELLIVRDGYSDFQILARAPSASPSLPNDGRVVISCVRWEEKGITVVTSVDIISLLEKLVGSSFSTEEKSRIRRNLQFLKPYTITRSSPESRRLFNLLMAMENPRPRNIEKDLKVFKWDDLFVAAQRVLSKYCANPNALRCKASPSSRNSPAKPSAAENHLSSLRPRRIWGYEQIFTDTILQSVHLSTVCV